MTSSTTRKSLSIPPTSLETHVLRDAMDRHRISLVQRLEGGEDGVDLGRANARFLNACFQLVFEGALRHVGLPSGVALWAVGSFGRGAVAIHSDADVVLIVDTDVVGTKEATAVVEALLYPLWDAGLAVGHQVLSADEVVPLAEKYLETATALLDLRWLAGDASLLAALVARANEGLFGDEHLGTFIDRLEAETASRRDRFGGSVYLLEPDLKNGAGGLRDLDGIRWAARARYRVGEVVPGAAGDARSVARARSARGAGHPRSDRDRRVRRAAMAGAQPPARAGRAPGRPARVRGSRGPRRLDGIRRRPGPRRRAVDAGILSLRAHRHPGAIEPPRAPAPAASPRQAGADRRARGRRPDVRRTRHDRGHGRGAEGPGARAPGVRGPRAPSRADPALRA